MKKNVIIIISIILSFSIAIIVGIKVIQVKKDSEVQANAERELKRLYYRQNEAFELGDDLNKRDFYHGVNELKLNEVVVYLHAFNNSQSKYHISVDEVVDYLSKEYDSDGVPMIYSQPENIEAYIAWNLRMGKDIITKFGDKFNDYLKEKGYATHFYREMSYEDVIKALDEYEKAPDYVSPEECAKNIN